MELNLTFAEGKLTGDGNDDVGRFVIKGRYSTQTLECWWTKTYVGGHDVFYRGFREGKGIWGTWEITPFNHGGFHIWPQGIGDKNTEVASAASSQTVQPHNKNELVVPKESPFCIHGPVEQNE